MAAYGLALAAYLAAARLEIVPVNAVLLCIVGWQALPFALIALALLAHRASPIGTTTALAVATGLTIWIFHDIAADHASQEDYFGLVYMPLVVGAAGALPLTIEWLARRHAGRA